MSSSVKHIIIHKVTAAGRKPLDDLLAVEEPLEIRLGYGPANLREQKSLSVTMRTPGHDYELASGFLFTEGIVSNFNEIESIKYCEDTGKQEEKENVLRVELRPEVKIDFEKLQRHFYTSSSCGVCGKSSIDSVKQQCASIQSDLKVKRDVIYALPDKLREKQLVFEHTGGLHASALFNAEGEMILLREDVGRHNALDKVIGAMLFKNEIPLSDYILLVSGRVSFELVQKATMSGI
ncbi:MAG TPA: formate dehydrogenase accessory sulfurtransferase FdhD, partial [Cyclobacteriaceae bacterium]|nr:formate dehydrogenase accessory sulfurtransferase FdhD [Cyclobacteriaceae bacterium]